MTDRILPAFLKPQERDMLASRLDELRAELQERNPGSLARRTGAKFERVDIRNGNTGPGTGVFSLRAWGRAILVGFPDFIARDPLTGSELDTLRQAMLVYYFHTSDGRPLARRWIAFSELPDGRFYNQAFQGYTGNALIKIMGNDVAGFEKAALSLGGHVEALGDCGFSFRVLPRVALAAVCWLGDEDFPPSYRILFDAAAGNHLTTDACAILGSMLTRSLIAAREGAG